MLTNPLQCKKEEAQFAVDPMMHMHPSVYRVGALGRGLIGLSSRSCVAHVCACVCECEFERECECACQETVLKLECLDGYLSPSTARPAVAQLDSLGSHHSPCATCHVPLSAL